MNVRTEPNVVSQIPTKVVGIVVDDNVIVTPIPIATIAYIVGCN